MSVIVVIGGAMALKGAAGLVIGATAIGAVADNILDRLDNNATKAILYPSIFKNQKLLTKVFKNLGSKSVTVKNDTITALIKNTIIECKLNSNSVYDIYFLDTQESYAEKMVKSIENEYGLVIQETVYNKLKEDAQNKGLALESEQLSEDRSIILTYNITK